MSSKHASLGGLLFASHSHIASRLFLSPKIKNFLGSRFVAELEGLSKAQPHLILRSQAVSFLYFFAVLSDLEWVICKVYIIKNLSFYATVCFYIVFYLRQVRDCKNLKIHINILDFFNQKTTNFNKILKIYKKFFIFSHFCA